MLLNKEKIYSDLKNCLKRERIFFESDKREDFLDEILNKIQHIDIYYIYSNKASSCIKFYNNDAVIIWDMQFWKCFHNYLIQVEHCLHTDDNIIQGIICVMAQFLLEKFNSIIKVSSFLQQIYEIFRIHVQDFEKYRNEISIIEEYSKLFCFYHEIGHLEYHKGNSDKIAACRELVVDMFNSLEESDFRSLGDWADLGWRSVCLVKQDKKGQILEELSSDIFAVINMINYYQSHSNGDNFKLACESVKSLEYISTFQNMFNAVNQAWDAHYVEMKMRLPVRHKVVDAYTNELSMARNGLCDLILVIVIQNMLHLDLQERKELWEIRDNNHIDNEMVIGCLADDDFICTAIEEAFL